MVINQFPFGLSPKQFTIQFGLCQGTTDPHRCEMVGGFYRCTLKIEDAVPVFSVPQSAAQAVGLQQAPLRHRPPQAETSQPGCWVGGKRENTRCQEHYRNTLFSDFQIGLTAVTVWVAAVCAL